MTDTSSARPVMRYRVRQRVSWSWSLSLGRSAASFTFYADTLSPMREKLLGERQRPPNQLPGSNAGGPRQFPIRTPPAPAGYPFWCGAATEPSA